MVGLKDVGTLRAFANKVPRKILEKEEIKCDKTEDNYIIISYINLNQNT